MHAGCCPTPSKQCIHCTYHSERPHAVLSSILLRAVVHRITMHLLIDLVCCYAGGLRSTQSTSALTSMPAWSPASAHRALNVHRTHGSQTALNYLSRHSSPSSLPRVPKSAESSLAFAQSAHVVAASLLASPEKRCASGQSHGQSRDWSHDAHWPSSPSWQSPKGFSGKLNDSSQGLAALR